MTEQPETMVEWVKRNSNFDMFVLICLSRGMSSKQTAEFLDISQRLVYKVIARNQELYERFIKNGK